MTPLFIDIGAVGSVTDIATFILVAFTLRSRLSTMAAGLVALAREHQAVDDDRLQDELDVDDEAVDAVRTTIIPCGGEVRDD